MNKRRLAEWTLIIGLLWVGFALRIYRLDTVNFRGDEAYSVVHWTASPLSADWWELIREEPAPMGAFTMYWAWNGLVGASEFAIRMLSVLGNWLGIAVIISLTRYWTHNWRLSLMVGVLWVWSPFWLWHAQDARVYGVLSALTPLTFYTLWRAVERFKTDSSWRPWWLYIALQTLALYLYYFETFWLVAQGLFILVLILNDNPLLFKRLFRVWLIVGILIIPMLLQVYYLMFVSQYTGNAGDADFVGLFQDFIPTLLFGEETSLSPWFGVTVMTLLIITLGWQYQQKRHGAGLLLLWLIIPPLMLYLVSFQSSFFRPRYVASVLPAILVSLVIGADFFAQKIKLPRFALPFLLTLILSGVFIRETYAYFYLDPPKAAEWDTLTTYLKARTTPYDVVIIGDADPALEYYYQDRAIFFIPLNGDLTSDNYEQLLNTYDGLFLLSGERMQPIQHYLQDKAQWIQGEPSPSVTQYRSWHVHPREIQHPLAVQFGDIAILHGYTYLTDSRGNTTHLFLYWEALQQTPTEHSILVHILADMDSIPIISLDHGLADSIISMTQWEAGVGTIYRDPIVIPTDLPYGDYIVRVGIYDTATIEKLPILNQSPDFDGRYPIGILQRR